MGQTPRRMKLILQHLSQRLWITSYLCWQSHTADRIQSVLTQPQECGCCVSGDRAGSPAITGGGSLIPSIMSNYRIDCLVPYMPFTFYFSGELKLAPVFVNEYAFLFTIPTSQSASQNMPMSPSHTCFHTQMPSKVLTSSRAAQLWIPKASDSHKYIQAPGAI